MSEVFVATIGIMFIHQIVRMLRQSWNYLRNRLEIIIMWRLILDWV